MMAPHSSTLAWKIPWTEEPGRLQSMGLLRVRHDWPTSLSPFTFTFHFHTLEKEMATHSSVLAWRIPGMGEPGGLPSMGLHRVGHNWSDLAVAAAAGKMRSLYYPFSLVYQQPDSFMIPLISKPACFAITLYQYSELISPSAKFLPWIKPTHCFLWSIWGQPPACTGASSPHSPAFLSVSFISSLFCSSWKLFQTFFLLKLLLTSQHFSHSQQMTLSPLSVWILEGIRRHVQTG